MLHTLRHDYRQYRCNVPPEVRKTDAMRAVIALTQTLFDQLELTKTQLQSTQENLTKAHEKIKTLEDEIAKLRKTPKRPKFRPNGMQPRDRSKRAENSSDLTPPTDGATLGKKYLLKSKSNYRMSLKVRDLKDIKHLMSKKSTS